MLRIAEVEGVGAGARAIADGLRDHVNRLGLSGDADDAALLGHLFDHRESLHVVGTSERARARTSKHGS